MFRLTHKWLPGFFLGLFILISNGFADQDFFSPGPAVFILDDFLLDNLPGAYFYPSFIENYAPDITLMNEESSGFALIDSPRVYFEGDSFAHFNWHYNGININSALHDGAPSVLLPFSSLTGYRLAGETPAAQNYGLNFVSTMPDRSLSKVMLSTVYTDMGSYTPWLSFLVEGHASTRDDRLYTSRRKTLYNHFVDCMFSRKFADSNLLLSLNYFEIKRQFNNFAQYDTTYEEAGQLFLFNSCYKKNLRKGAYEIFAVFNYQERSNLDAEFGSLPQETAAEERYTLLTAMALKKETFALQLSIQYEKENIDPFADNFSKELMDNDGDGFFPQSKIGEFSAVVFNAELDVPFKFNLFNKEVKINTFLDLRHALLQGQEAVHDYNPILFGNTAYLVVLWDKGKDYHNSNSNMKSGMDITYDISKNFSLVSRFLLHYSRLRFDYSENNLTFVTPGFDLGLLLFKNKKTSLLLAYGVLPYDIKENTNLFLETNRPSAAIYRWIDSSGDLNFQPGEEGEVFGYSGGLYHHAAEDVAAPLKQRLMLDLSTKLSRHWVLNVKGTIKKIKNNFTVRFPRDYGFFERYNSQEIYFFDQPFDDYLLSNYDYRKDPFYAQLLLHLKGGVKNSWFFNFSFLAHIGMGVTAFGNGPGANDIGIIHESMANPNSWINAFGRVDGDRAFMAKLYFGFYLARHLFMGISLKYRDGTPFAFINSLYAHDQWVLFYATIKAEDERGVKGGPREDYVGDLSLRLNYQFKLFNTKARLSLSLFNILDLGHELSEYVFSGGSRDAMELNIPRSLRLTLALQF